MTVLATVLAMYAAYASYRWYKWRRLSLGWRTAAVECLRLTKLQNTTIAILRSAAAIRERQLASKTFAFDPNDQPKLN